MKLYLKAGACSLSPHIVLEESGLPYETEAVDLQARRTASGVDFLTINPKGYVPALQLDSGEVLTEGPAIVQYIADLVPDRKLAPANGTIERYRLQSWLNYIGTELHKTYGALFSPAAPAEWKAVAVDALQRHFVATDAHLAQRPFLLGDTFTVADAYLFNVLGWAPYVKLDLSPHASLQAFQARVAARPAVVAALRAEGLLK